MTEDLLNDEECLFDYEEEKIVPEGTMCHFTIIDAKRKSNDKGTKWLEVGLMLTNDEFPNIKAVYDRFFDAKPDDDKKKKNAKLGFKVRFCKAIEYQPDDGIIKPEELLGKEGDVILKIEKSDEYGDKNVVKKYVQPASEFPG